MRASQSGSGRNVQVIKMTARAAASRQKSRSFRAYPPEAVAPAAVGAIIAVGTSKDRMAQLARALPGVPLVSAASVTECETRITQVGASAVFFSIPAAGRADHVADLVSVISRYPQSVWIGLFEEGESDLSVVNALAKAGAADTLRAALVAEPEALRRVLSRAAPQSTTERILSELDSSARPELVDLLRLALNRAHTPLTVAQLADARRVHERTLRKMCEQEGLPSPQWIVGWARCLIVAFYLQDAGRTIQSTAKLLGFSSPASMANHLRRYTGKTAKVLREEGALDSVVRAMHAEV